MWWGTQSLVVVSVVCLGFCADVVEVKELKASGNVPMAPPPVVTQEQQAALTRLAAAAQQASTAAFPAVLAKLGDAEFVQILTAKMGGPSVVEKIGLNISDPCVSGLL